MLTNRSIIAIDCEKRINARLRLWLKDSMQLYQTAGLGPHEFTLDVTSALVYMMLRICAGCEVPIEPMFPTMLKIYESIIKDQENEQAK